MLSRNLRGKYDLHGWQYRPNVWSFVEVKGDRMTLEDLVWSKRQWELMRDGGVWAIPNGCIVMQSDIQRI